MSVETRSLTLTRSDFEAVALHSEVPVLVDFWAEWCGPCRMISKTIDELAEEYAGRAKVARVNVDEEPELAEEWGVRSIPNLIFFKNGKPVDGLVGAVTKAALAEKLDSLL